MGDVLLIERKVDVACTGRSRTVTWLWLLTMLVLALTACRAPSQTEAPSVAASAATAAPAAAASSAPAATPRSSHGSPGPAPASPSPDASVRDALVARAVAAAAAYTGVPASGIRVVDVSERVWSDRSLGCPEPGMGYAQALTPGFLISLEAGGASLHYHTDHAQVVRCDR